MIRKGGAPAKNRSAAMKFLNAAFCLGDYSRASPMALEAQAL
jgi:hypothetical protein